MADMLEDLQARIGVIDCEARNLVTKADILRRRYNQRPVAARCDVIAPLPPYSFLAWPSVLPGTFQEDDDYRRIANVYFEYHHANLVALEDLQIRIERVRCRYWSVIENLRAVTIAAQAPIRIPTEIGATRGEGSILGVPGFRVVIPQGETQTVPWHQTIRVGCFPVAADPDYTFPTGPFVQNTDPLRLQGLLNQWFESQTRFMTDLQLRIDLLRCEQKMANQLAERTRLTPR
jgi:hypothetical protein